jgi:hypothetical protein
MYSNTKRYKYRCAASSLLDGLGVLGGLLQWGGHKVVRGCYRCARAAAQIHAAHRSSIGVLGGLLARGRTVVAQASSLLGVLGGLLQRAGTVADEASAPLGVLGGLLQRGQTVVVQASSLPGVLGVLGGLLQWGGHKVVRGCYRCARAAAQLHAAHRSSIGVLGGLLARGRTVVVQASSLPGVLAKYGYDYALVTWMRTLLLVGDQQLNGYGMHEHVYISFIECAEYAC